MKSKAAIYKRKGITGNYVVSAVCEHVLFSELGSPIDAFDDEVEAAESADALADFARHMGCEVIQMEV
jgi:hypothetical protein